MSQCGNQQIEPAIPVDVCEHSSATDVVRGVHAPTQRHILKPPPTKIPVERVATLQTAQENIRQPVAIEVASRRSASVFQDSIRCAGALIQQVGELDSGLLGCQVCESGSPFFGKLQFSPLRMLCLVPRELSGRNRKRPDDPGTDNAGNDVPLFHLARCRHQAP